MDIDVLNLSLHPVELCDIKCQRCCVQTMVYLISKSYVQINGDKNGREVDY